MKKVLYYQLLMKATLFFCLAFLACKNLNAVEVEEDESSPIPDNLSSFNDNQRFAYNQYFKIVHNFELKMNNMNSNKGQLLNADGTNDYLERYRVYNDVEKKLKRGIDFADLCIENIIKLEEKSLLSFNLERIEKKRKYFYKKRKQNRIPLVCRRKVYEKSERSNNRISCKDVEGTKIGKLIYK